MTELVLDSWPILEWMLQREPASSLFRAMLQRAEEGDLTLLISRLNFGEVLYSLRKPLALRSQARNDEDLHALPITLVSVADRHVDAAVDLKSRFAISYADCFAAALAKEYGAHLVTGDPEFRKLESAGILRLHWLGI